MVPEEAETLKAAFELYRYVRSEVLPLFRGAQTDKIEACIDDLKEVLLDLKQATIDLDPPRAAQCIKEVLQLVGELRDFGAQE